MGDLTKNLSKHEMACHCGCGFGDTHGLVDPDLACVFQSIRDIARVPIGVNSGCRCTKHNKKIGGARSSQHLLGKAMDIHCGTINPEGLRRIARRIPTIGGIGIYNTFLHIDVREGNRVEWDERT